MTRANLDDLANTFSDKRLTWAPVVGGKISPNFTQLGLEGLTSELKSLFSFMLNSPFRFVFNTKRVIPSNINNIGINPSLT